MAALRANCSGPSRSSDHHEAVAVEQFRSTLDLAWIEHLEAPDAVVSLQLLPQPHDIRIVVRLVHPAHAGSPPIRL